MVLVGARTIRSHGKLTSDTPLIIFAVLGVSVFTPQRKSHSNFLPFKACVRFELWKVLLEIVA